MPNYNVVVECDGGRLPMEWQGVADNEDKAAEAAELAYRKRYPESEKLQLTVTRLRPPL